MEKNYSNIIADHFKASCFIIADGIRPSAKQRGYILRKLIRRSLSASLKLKIDISNENYFVELVDSVIKIYDGVFDEIKENRQNILDVFLLESQKYLKAIDVGKKEWQKILKVKLQA
jgi:alanyl-tRNA synthetase